MKMVEKHCDNLLETNLKIILQNCKIYDRRLVCEWKVQIKFFIIKKKTFGIELVIKTQSDALVHLRKKE